MIYETKTYEFEHFCIIIIIGFVTFEELMATDNNSTEHCCLYTDKLVIIHCFDDGILS